MTFYARSAWTSKGKGGTVLKGSGRTMTTIYIHYPGQRSAIGRASVAATKRRLEGYRAQHKNANGWADIAYNLGVDQDGNVWELRGIDRQSGANGGTRSNRSGQAILVLVGNDEAPTADCIAGIREAVRRIRAEHPQARAIRGHQQSPDASTACPGPHLMRLVRAGALEPGAAAPVKVPAGGASVPVKAPAKAPAGVGKLKVDGRAGTSTMAALQRFLASRGHNPGKIDGRAGESTWRALQAYLGVKPADGKIGWQSYRPGELGNGIVDRGTAWGFTGRGSKGSPTVKALQVWLKVKADGVWGEATTAALQRKLNAHGVGM